MDTQELEYSTDLSSRLSESDSDIETDEFLETQELQYSVDLSDSSEEHSSEESLPDVLKPFDFEPVCSPRKDEIVTSSDEEKHKNTSSGEKLRKGNTNWCLCGKCKAMDTEAESFCCRDTNEVPDDYFEGHMCVTESCGFQMVCLSKPVLKTALSALNHYRGDSLENIDKRYFRFAGYKQYIFWVYNYLGKGVRKVIPSCAVWRIRNEFKANDDEVYVPFSESRADEI